jgi:uncharacterized membrane protein
MASISTAQRSGAAAAFRFGQVSRPEGGEWSVQWLLRRNCSTTPHQLLVFYVVLCGLSLGIAAMFWMQGATMIMPFAWAEVIAVGAALLVHAAHASDAERIRLQGGMLTVEHACGRHTDRVEFRPDWVRVEPEHGDGSLIELSGQGQRIVVGRFVRPELRRQLADELRWALRRGYGNAGRTPMVGTA